MLRDCGLSLMVLKTFVSMATAMTLQVQVRVVGMPPAKEALDLAAMLAIAAVTVIALVIRCRITVKDVVSQRASHGPEQQVTATSKIIRKITSPITLGVNLKPCIHRRTDLVADTDICAKVVSLMTRQFSYLMQAVDAVQLTRRWCRSRSGCICLDDLKIWEFPYIHGTEAPLIAQLVEDWGGEGCWTHDNRTRVVLMTLLTMVRLSPALRRPSSPYASD